MVNGEYEVKLVALDASAGIQEWKLGSIKIWFKEGQFETNNQGVNKNYLLKETVIAQFPPPNQKEKNPLLPLAFILAIIGAFIFHMMQQAQQKANLKRIDFWGSLFILNLVAICGILTAFWLQVNLIDTLWALLFITPFTLFLFSQGLAGSASCDIPN